MEKELVGKTNLLPFNLLSALNPLRTLNVLNEESWATPGRRPATLKKLNFAKKMLVPDNVYNKIQNIPSVSKIRVFIKPKSHRNPFYNHFQ